MIRRFWLALPLLHLTTTSFLSAQPCTDTKLLLSAIDCLWNTVVGSPSNTSRLVERDGILHLLDCLEETSFAPRAQLLSCLADLLNDERAVAQCQVGPEG